MISKIERWFFYPVMVLATLASFGILSAERYFISVPPILAMALLWLKPFLPLKFYPVTRLIFWIAFAGVTLWALGILAWYLASKL